VKLAVRRDRTNVRMGTSGEVYFTKSCEMIAARATGAATRAVFRNRGRGVVVGFVVIGHLESVRP
jgi:hypothetical protein